MEELQNIIKELKKICEEEELAVSADVVLDCATRIYNQGNISKDKARQQYPQKPSYSNSGATDKQKGMLKNLGYKGDLSQITKQEATKLIQEMLSRKEQPW